MFLQVTGKLGFILAAGARYPGCVGMLSRLHSSEISSIINC